MIFEINTYGDLIWRNEYGQLHRKKGPAHISTDEGVGYYFNDSPHRLDGPARIWPDGNKQYFIDGIEYIKGA